MKYLVVECHPAYAVVLDESGKFIKTANMHYKVGDTVTHIVEMNLPETKPKPKISFKWINTLVASAACLLFVFIPMLLFGGRTVHASVYMTINPQIRIDVNEENQVLDIQAINDDGTLLIKDFSYKNKDLEKVLDELLDLAIQKDYLKEDGKITLSLDTEDDEWLEAKKASLDSHLHSYLCEKLPYVTVVVIDSKESIPESSSAHESENSFNEESKEESMDVSEDESSQTPNDESMDVSEDVSSDIPSDAPVEKPNNSRPNHPPHHDDDDDNDDDDDDDDDDGDDD